MVRKRPQRRTQGGFIVTIELLFLAAICVIGLIVGMTSLRDSVLAELSDLSEAVGSINQGYSVLGLGNSAGTASTSPSAWADAQDTNAGHIIDTAGLGNADAEYTFVFATSPLAETQVPLMTPLP